MRSMCVLSRRPVLIAMLTLVALWASLTPVSAQGVGVGGRIAWVNPDTEVDVDAVRYFGGQLRLVGRRIGVEVSMDTHSETLEAADQKVTLTPIQASFLLKLGGTKFSPFLLGGPGWYRRKVEALDGPADLDISTTEFGWHAGIGLELLPSRHFGIHGDYRYTFLDFGDDDDDGGGGIIGIPGIGGLLPGHRGSMWTLGATYYF
jgi:opacity protein-like surface antigen